MFSLDSDFYVGTFKVIVMPFWPLFLLFAETPIMTTLAIIIFVLNLILLYFTFKYIKIDNLDFDDQFCAIAEHYMTGCANITIVFIFPVLFYYYLYAMIYTVQGLLKGKQYTRDNWSLVIQQFIDIDDE